jgi:hypothetical protein
MLSCNVSKLTVLAIVSAALLLTAVPLTAKAQVAGGTAPTQKRASARHCHHRHHRHHQHKHQDQGAIKPSAAH